MLLYHVTDVAQTGARADHFDAAAHALVTDGRQTARNHRGFADKKYLAGIAVEPVFDDRDVDIDHIAGFKAAFTGYAVADLVVEAGADVQNEKAWLFLRRDTIQLPPVPAASGVKFDNGEHVFWIKGDEAMLNTPKRKHKDCRNNLHQAIWEHAKLNGVDFRAVGNEPGWLLEISNKAEILFVTDYGQSRYSFVGAGVSSATQGLTTIYEARNDQGQIEIKLTAERCGDTMSDEKFPVTVNVLLNQSEYNGCGKALY